MKITFWFWLLFLTVYFTVGDSADKYWSCLFFCINYILLCWLFLKQSKPVKIIGTTISISLFIFSIVKLFINENQRKTCIFILFIISVITCLKLFNNEQNKRNFI